jgi:hypothetical protein
VSSVSGIDNLLSRLRGVRRTGDRQWIACCPSHADRSPSLSIRDTGDGRVLLKCFAECATEDVLAAVGLTFRDVMPERAGGEVQALPGVVQPFEARTLLLAAADELRVAYIIAADFHRQGTIGKDARARLAVAMRRIGDAARAATGYDDRSRVKTKGKRNGGSHAG